MGARNKAELNRLSTQSFLDDLTASKNDQLRNTMNSGIIGSAPDGDVIARKTRNPQTLQETREEISKIQQQNSLQEKGYKQAISNLQVKKAMEMAPWIIIAFFLFK